MERALERLREKEKEKEKEEGEGMGYMYPAYCTGYYTPRSTFDSILCADRKVGIQM